MAQNNTLLKWSIKISCIANVLQTLLEYIVKPKSSAVGISNACMALPVYL